MTTLPAHFIKTITTVHDDGAEWIAAFPEILAGVAQRYALTLGEPFELSYNYVCAATRRDGTPVVLKLSPPYDEFYGEVAAMRHYAGEGCVKVLDADPDAGIVIMERIFPGKTLHAMSLVDDEAATRIIAEIMRQLWKPLPAEHDFTTVERWSHGLQRLRDDHHGTTGPLPADLVERAESLYRDLLASAPPPVLLHGDLHHDNVLSDARSSYIAIDPKGVAGEPAYEVGPFFYNPQPEVFTWSDLSSIFARRIAIFSEHLQITRERLLACAFAHSVLSAAWSIEDQDEWQGTVRVAEALLQLF